MTVEHSRPIHVSNSVRGTGIRPPPPACPPDRDVPAADELVMPIAIGGASGLDQVEAGGSERPVDRTNLGAFRAPAEVNGR
jgi:hypothetical protein